MGSAVSARRHPPTNLGTVYQILGEYPKALAADQHALKLDPSGNSYANLVNSFLLLNRLQEAKALAREAETHHLDIPFLHLQLYSVDFLQHDAAGMQREAAFCMSSPGNEDIMLYYESETAAYTGHFVKARELTRRAADAAGHGDKKEEEARYESAKAVLEALVGNTSLARRQAQAALALSNGRDVEAFSAIALGLAGISARSKQLADDLNKRFPEDTVVQSEYLPMIRAGELLGWKNSSRVGDKAVEALAAAEAYELGSPGPINFALYPPYLRGEAYLAAREGAAAATEFQKILDNPGVVQNEPIGALAHLGLGRAYALEAGIGVLTGLNPLRVSLNRDRLKGQQGAFAANALVKARAAYRDFFALWKDADPDIPILHEAKAEYAKLQRSAR
jgi:eukaryotic-like serine/threonine-protein kinase